MLDYFYRGKSTAETIICETYGEHTVFKIIKVRVNLGSKGFLKDFSKVYISILMTNLIVDDLRR